MPLTAFNSPQELAAAIQGDQVSWMHQSYGKEKNSNLPFLARTRPDLFTEEVWEVILDKLELTQSFPNVEEKLSVFKQILASTHTNGNPPALPDMKRFKRILLDVLARTEDITAHIDNPNAPGFGHFSEMFYVIASDYPELIDEEFAKAVARAVDKIKKPILVLDDYCYGFVAAMQSILENRKDLFFSVDITRPLQYRIATGANQIEKGGLILSGLSVLLSLTDDEKAKIPVEPEIAIIARRLAHEIRQDNTSGNPAVQKSHIDIMQEFFSGKFPIAGGKYTQRSTESGQSPDNITHPR